LKHDWGIGHDELGEHLAASAAGRACLLIEVGDGDGFNANLRSELGTALTKAERSAQMVSPKLTFSTFVPVTT